MSRSEDWGRTGGILIALLAAGLALLVLAPRRLGVATGPEVEVITWLKTTERDGLVLRLPGVADPLRIQEHFFARITVDVAPDGAHAVAWATLDLKGMLGRTRVSSLGVERVPFVRRGRDWVPEGLAAPRLGAVLRALDGRRQALETGDRTRLTALLAGGTPGAAGLGEGADEVEKVLAVQRRHLTVDAWYLRLERDDARATEVWRLEGVLPSRPVDDRGERPLSLIRREEEFFFSPGLM
ncbi:hypothetical protein [Melittangium boletus]|uniref:hypothetical protein n=1 Tax=Melittangium boletus TaxID=83453 RepID=UPI003DA231CB